MNLPLRWLWPALLTLGCADDFAPSSTSTGTTCGPEATSSAIVIQACGAGSLSLVPRVRLAGTWHGGGDDGACELSGKTLSCPAGPAGSVEAEVTAAGVTLRFVASSATTVEGFALDGSAKIPGARAWLSNGFQSWSQSGAIALGAKPSDAELAAALAERGDAEVVRNGKAQSWSYSVVGGAKSHLLAGALTAARFKPWVEAWNASGGKVGLRIASGATGESVSAAAGDSVSGEAFWLELGSDLPALLRAYADELPSRHRDNPRPAEAGWNSWYELWDGVTEQDVRDNAPLAKAALAPKLPAGTKLRIVVDDGWEKLWGEWEPNGKFSSGLDGLSKDLHAQGFEMGVWLAPLLVHESSALVSSHPDWFVKDAVYKHLSNGNMRVLDVTNPGAADHLKSVIKTIVGWGYDLLKIDFLFAGTFEGGRTENVTGMQAYDRALSMIRDAAGEGVVLVAVGAPDVASLPHVDSWRVGGDIALALTGPAWVFLPSQARSIATRVPFCMATLCDPDPLVQRVLAQEEVETGGHIVAFAGGAFFLSDDQRKLPAERRDWGFDTQRVARALGGQPAIPVDFLPANAPSELVSAILDQLVAKKSSRHVVPQIWQLPDGSRVGLNVTDDPVSIAGTSVPGRAVRPLD